jgi:hypothetical protein
MKPIETHYKGYHFRSRLEARWAVFFDHIPKVEWVYEPEGYDLDGTWYLVDFLVKNQYNERAFIEIKPDTPSATEIRKCEELLDVVDHSLYTRVFLFAGSCGFEEFDAYEWDQRGHTLWTKKRPEAMEEDWYPSDLILGELLSCHSDDLPKAFARARSTRF